MTKHQLNVGFIGCGRIATLHRLGYINNPNAKLTAICSRHKDEINRIARDWHIEHVYTDYHEMLSNTEIDMVEILTPHNAHFQIASAAAKAKKHISLQKVPVMTLKEYDELVKIVKQNNVKFRVFENFRFHKPYQRALELIESGKLGKVKTVNQRMWASYKTSKEWPYPLKSLAWRMKESANYSSPTLFDDGFHKHSIAQLFLPAISSVKVWCQKAKLKGLLQLDVPSVVIYETKHKDTFGTWNVSTYPSLPIRSHYYTCDELLEITLEHGLIFVYGCTGNMLKKGIDWMDEKGIWHNEIIPNSDWKYSFINSTQNFIDSILFNKKASLNEKEARDVLKITLATVKSFKTNGASISTVDNEIKTINPSQGLELI